MSVLNGPGEGTWSVYAGELQAKLDAAEAEVERLTRRHNEAQSECARLREVVRQRETSIRVLDREIAVLRVLRVEVEALKGLVYIGEHHFPQLTWKARCEEAYSDLRSAREEVERLKALALEMFAHADEWAGTRASSHYRSEIYERIRGEKRP